MKQVLRSGRLPHALLFEGVPGSGKRAMACELAKLFFCKNKQPEEVFACGVCSACRRVDQNSHPDFMIVEPDEGASVIKIEEIRLLIERINYKPLQAPCKVFLIDGAERMNETAQNALLKTLEEPPGNAYIVLTTSSPEELLDTIRSRSQCLKFKSLGSSAAGDDGEYEIIKNQSLEFIATELKSISCSGSVAPGETLLRAPDLGGLERSDLLKLLEDWIVFFRDCAVIQRQTEDLLIVKKDIRLKRELSQILHPEDTLKKIETLATVKARLLDNANVKLTIINLWEEFFNLSYAR